MDRDLVPFPVGSFFPFGAELGAAATSGAAFAAALDSYRSSIYNTFMIQSFRCADTERLFRRERVGRFASFEAVARRKLDQLNAAATLGFLRAPPGNRLEALKGDRVGQHSIRVNDQFRLCFIWTAQGPKDVELVDYH
jgi:proteic killer suppression protein